MGGTGAMSFYFFQHNRLCKAEMKHTRLTLHSQLLSSWNGGKHEVDTHLNGFAFALIVDRPGKESGRVLWDTSALDERRHCVQRLVPDAAKSHLFVHLL